MNRVIFSAVREEAEKLVRRHQKYLSDLAGRIRRKERRSGIPIVKTLHSPSYWSADKGFNPYHVRSHAAGIAYAIDKALASGQYKPSSPWCNPTLLRGGVYIRDSDDSEAG
jgi:RNA-directed DNA polymerase